MSGANDRSAARTVGNRESIACKLVSEAWRSLPYESSLVGYKQSFVLAENWASHKFLCGTAFKICCNGAYLRKNLSHLATSVESSEYQNLYFTRPQ